jgi:nucleotide-binding universal stress UspA family protein
MFFFAYDGSINGDWVSHYAVQLAAAHHDRALTLVHVCDGQFEAVVLAEKLRRMRLDCERLGVQLTERLLPPTEGSLFDAIRSVVPDGPEHFLVCGKRAQELRRGCLNGTTSEQLLRSGHCNVLAVRVVQPGLLGSPRRLLVPIVERGGGFRSGLPFLRLFSPQLSHLHIVLVARIGSQRFRHLSHEHGEHLRAAGQAYCERVEREIVEQLGLGGRVMDAEVIVSDQIHREILIAANRTKSRLVYMGASARNRAERFLHGDPTEQILREATCDVAIYRGIT